VAYDVAMTAKTLHLVNSTFFGVSRRVDGAADAASLLGINTLKPLIVSEYAFHPFDASETPSFSIEAFTRHSIAVSRLAKRIAKSIGAPEEVIVDSELAGLLHDVGQLVLASRRGREFEQAVQAASERGISLEEAEIEFVGMSHTSVGGLLLGLWGIDDEIVDAVAGHHDPHQSAVTEFSPLTAVHLANALVNEVGPNAEAFRSSQLDVQYISSLGLTDRIPEWREMCRSNAGAVVGA
jgi:putative nucleotidyltransferase with HDIG domain